MQHLGKIIVAVLFSTAAMRVAATETDLETTGLEVSDASSVGVGIENLDDDTKKIGLSKDMIEARVNAVLRKNGLKPFDAMSKPTAPFYCVQVSVVGIFSAINASFGRRVTFNDGIRESNALADTWKRGIRGSADIGADPSKIVDSSLDEVSKLTEVFANEFLKANRKSSTPQTENSVGGQHQASEETKADAPATQSPKANEEAEEIEEMNDWHGVSPGKALFAVTRFIPDPVYMQRHDHDGVAVGIFRGEFQTPAIVARHNFRGLFIAHIEWSPDSKFLLFTTATLTKVSDMWTLRLATWCPPNSISSRPTSPAWRLKKARLRKM
jgi:hypothetical protein